MKLESTSTRTEYFSRNEFSIYVQQEEDVNLKKTLLSLSQYEHKYDDKCLTIRELKIRDRIDCTS